jgi:hypothetical protein
MISMTSPVDVRSCTDYARRDISEGAVGGVCEYGNNAPITKEGIGACLEIGMQLEREWGRRRPHAPPRSRAA